MLAAASIFPNLLLQLQPSVSAADLRPAALAAILGGDLDLHWKRLLLTGFAEALQELSSCNTHGARTIRAVTALGEHPTAPKISACFI